MKQLQLFLANQLHDKKNHTFKTVQSGVPGVVVLAHWNRAAVVAGGHQKIRGSFSGSVLFFKRFRNNANMPVRPFARHLDSVIRELPAK